MEAYNARDLDRFLAVYSSEVVIEDGAGNLLMHGLEAMRRHYGTMFATCPELHCRVISRIRCGEYVVDEERITGRGPAERHAVAIYRVENGQIVHVRFLR